MRVFEGTWEEIKEHETELSGLRIQVIVGGPISSVAGPARPFYESATPEEWSRLWR